MNHFYSFSAALILTLILFLVSNISLASSGEDGGIANVLSNYEHQQKAVGIKLDWSDFIPPPVPDGQNFALNAIMIQGLERNKSGKPGGQLDMTSTYDDDYPTNGGWLRGEMIDLKAWQNYYRRESSITNLFPVPIESGNPGEDVLFALQIYSTNLEILRAGSKLPYSRFPLDYNAPYPFMIALPHLAPLEHCTKMLGLRACAELNVSKTQDAFADVELMLKLTDSMKVESFIISQLVRSAMMRATLQPVWEGLSEHRWSDAQLSQLQTDLRQFNFLKDCQNALGGEQAAFLTTVNKLSKNEDFAAFTNFLAEVGDVKADSNSYLRLWRLMPKGWWLTNELYFATECQEDGLPSIHSNEGRIYAYHLKNLERNLNVETNGDDLALAKRALLIFTYYPPKFAFIQSMVDLATVDIALERYRLAHGNYPHTLIDLCPIFLNADKIPREIMTGNSLHYQLISHNHFKLFSAGWNETDNEAEVMYSSANNVDHKQGNWVWPETNKK